MVDHPDQAGLVNRRGGQYGHGEAGLTPLHGDGPDAKVLDPILTDHLGDVYWAVGRTREARFQWHRALSFEPEEEDAERIRRKLEVGLDVVLEEEGAPPLHMANDDG